MAARFNHLVVCDGRGEGLNKKLSEGDCSSRLKHLWQVIEHNMLKKVSGLYDKTLCTCTVASSIMTDALICPVIASCDCSVSAESGSHRIRRIGRVQQNYSFLFSIFFRGGSQFSTNTWQAPRKKNLLWHFSRTLQFPETWQQDSMNIDFIDFSFLI